MLKEIEKRIEHELEETPPVKQRDPERTVQTPAADIDVSKKVADKSFALLKSLLHSKTNNLDLKKVGRELSSLITDPDERNEAADALESLAASLRKY